MDGVEGHDKDEELFSVSVGRTLHLASPDCNLGVVVVDEDVTWQRTFGPPSGEIEEESLLFIHVICQRWPFKNCHLSLALEMKCQFQNDYIGNSLETECPRGAAHRHCHGVTGVVPGMTENHLNGSKGWQNMMCIVIGWVGYDLSVIMYTVNCDFLSYFPRKWR